MADPGFPRGGGANSPGGAPTYDFAKISQKLHEIERICTPGGGRASKILLCRSVTEVVRLLFTASFQFSQLAQLAQFVRVNFGKTRITPSDHKISHFLQGCSLQSFFTTAL